QRRRCGAFLVALPAIVGTRGIGFTAVVGAARAVGKSRGARTGRNAANAGHTLDGGGARPNVGQGGAIVPAAAAVLGVRLQVDARPRAGVGNAARAAGTAPRTPVARRANRRRIGTSGPATSTASGIEQARFAALVRA